MQVVVEINDNLYTRLFDNGVDNYDDAVDMAKAIRKGKPLPKGHGDLIDRNSILCDDLSCELCGWTDECFKLLAPTVIEADKEQVLNERKAEK